MRVDSAILLAAGGSSRMGHPKALLPLGGEPIVRRHVRALAAVACRVVVVTGGHADLVRAALPPELPVAIVHNDRWQQTWPLDSLALALRSLPLAAPLLVSPVDVLPPSPETLARLLASAPPAVPVCQGQRGHPVLLGPVEVERIRAGHGAEEGLRGLLQEAQLVEVDDPYTALDFDDEAAWLALSARWRG